MTTEQSKVELQILFEKLNNVYRELRQLYDFYNTDIMDRVARIHSSEAENTIEKLASIVPGMEEDSLFCFKIFFDWIEAEKAQVKPVSARYMLPKIIEDGKIYLIITSTRKKYELCIDNELASIKGALSIRKLEKIVCEWENMIQTQKQQVNLLYHRLGM